MRELIWWSPAPPTFHGWLFPKLTFCHMHWNESWWLGFFLISCSHCILERWYLHLWKTLSLVTNVSKVGDCTNILVVSALYRWWSSIMIHFLDVSFSLSHTELWGSIFEIESGDMYWVSWSLGHMPWLNILHYRILTLEWSGVRRQLIIDHMRVWSIIPLWLNHLWFYRSVHQVLVAKAVVRDLSR